MLQQASANNDDVLSPLPPQYIYQDSKLLSLVLLNQFKLVHDFCQRESADELRAEHSDCWPFILSLIPLSKTIHKFTVSWIRFHENQVQMMSWRGWYSTFSWLPLEKTQCCLVLKLLIVLKIVTITVQINFVCFYQTGCNLFWMPYVLEEPKKTKQPLAGPW